MIKLTEDQKKYIERVAVKHEDFGFGLADSHGITTHGFSPEGLENFIVEILENIKPQ